MALARARAEISALGAFAVAALGLLVFAGIADEANEGETHVFDESIILSLRTPGDPGDPIGPGWFDQGMGDITALGGIFVLTFIVFSVVIYLLMTSKWKNALVVAGASITGVVLSQSLKIGFGRPRPELVPQLVEVHSLSFPSGHAMHSAVIYLTLGALLARFHKRKRERALIMLYAVLVTMMVGASRVYLGVHWPTDVIAGWALGAAWAALWWLFAWKFLDDKKETASAGKEQVWMRILCTNDDGVYARGLESLVHIARELSDDVWVCAPQEEQSGAARALTLAHPIRLRQYDERRFAVTGTPSDAVLMGINKVLGGEKPDLILSGVNNGQNLAEDVTVSGTIAGAFQGMSMGVPSIALSLSRLARDKARWETAEAHGAKIVRMLLDAGWPEHVVMNVNFPDRAPDDVAGIEATAQGHRDAVQLFAEERQDLRGGSYYWYGFTGELSNPPEGTDLRAIYDGRISITPLHLSLTDIEARTALAEAIAARGEKA